MSEALYSYSPTQMANATTKSSAKRKPVHAVYCGDVSASVFVDLRTSEKGRPWRSYSISLQRSYTDPKTEQRAYSNSLFDSDLLDASEASVQAYHWIEQDRREAAKATAQEEAEATVA